MFGLPFEAIEFIFSSVAGALTTMVGLKMKMAAQQTELLIRGIAAQNNATISLNESINKSPFMAMTRRALAFGVFGLLVFVMVSGYFDKNAIINVAKEVKTGGEYIFGLIDTRTTNITYEQMKGVVMLPWFKHIALIVFGTYFGSSIAKV